MAENINIGLLILTPLIVVGALALALSGNLQAAATIFSLYWIYPVSIFISLIPFFGIFIQWYVMVFISDIMQVPSGIAWMESVIFWVSILIGTIICIVTSVASAMEIRNHIKTWREKQKND